MRCFGVGVIEVAVTGGGDGWIWESRCSEVGCFGLVEVAIGFSLLEESQKWFCGRGGVYAVSGTCGFYTGGTILMNGDFDVVQCCGRWHCVIVVARCNG